MTQEKKKRLKRKAHAIQMRIHDLIGNYQSNSPKCKDLQLKLFRLHMRIYNPTKYAQYFRHK